MEARKHAKQIMQNLLAGLFGVAALLVSAERPLFAGEGVRVLLTQAQTGAGSPPAPVVGRGAPSMMIYLDPQTGAILKEPPTGTMPLPLSERERNALSTSHDGLAQVPSALPGGGVKLDLKGRFQKPLVATVDADGNFKTQRSGAPPPARDQK